MRGQKLLRQMAGIDQCGVGISSSHVCASVIICVHLMSHNLYLGMDFAQANSRHRL